MTNIKLFIMLSQSISLCGTLPETSCHPAIDIAVEEDESLQNIHIIVEVPCVAGQVFRVTAGEEAARVGAVEVPPPRLGAVDVRAGGALPVLTKSLYWVRL